MCRWSKHGGVMGVVLAAALVWSCAGSKPKDPATEGQRMPTVVYLLPSDGDPEALKLRVNNLIIPGFLGYLNGFTYNLAGTEYRLAADARVAGARSRVTGEYAGRNGRIVEASVDFADRGAPFAGSEVTVSRNLNGFTESAAQEMLVEALRKAGATSGRAYLKRMWVEGTAVQLTLVVKD